MANPFYVEGEQRAQKVNDLFARVAPRYDFINDLQSFGLHRAWKRRVVRMANLRPGDRALDVCCGTGDIAFGLAQSGAQVDAVDFSDAMLAVARQRLAAANEPRSSGREEAHSVSDGRNQSLLTSAATAQGCKARMLTPHFQRADAMELPFADKTFDAVTVGYGLRNLSDWEQGLREMHRVAKAGGRLLVLDFGKPDNTVWRSLYFFYLRACVPVFGKLFCGDAATHAYILESLHRYPAQRGVADAMGRLNCRDVRIVNLLAGAMSINYGVKG